MLRGRPRLYLRSLICTPCAAGLLARRGLFWRRRRPFVLRPNRRTASREIPYLAAFNIESGTPQKSHGPLQCGMGSQTAAAPVIGVSSGLAPSAAEGQPPHGTPSASIGGRFGEDVPVTIVTLVTIGGLLAHRRYCHRDLSQNQLGRIQPLIASPLAFLPFSPKGRDFRATVQPVGFSSAFSIPWRLQEAGRNPMQPGCDGCSAAQSICATTIFLIFLRKLAVVAWLRRFTAPLRKKIETH